MTLLLILLLIQGALGAIDTLVHHELAAALPSRPGARFELALHGAREAIYGAVFLGLAWFAWTGAFAVGLAVLMAVEVVITLTDFVEEDRTRRLPPSERVLHTLMAIGFGVILMALAPVLIEWLGAPTAVVFTPHGLLSWLMTAVGLGVLVWAVRDTMAAMSKTAPLAIREAGSPREGTVLVTGATGFIGRAVVAALLTQGRRVIVLTRDALAARAQFGAGVIIVEDLAAAPAELRVDAVVNLAGAATIGGLWTRRRQRRLLESRRSVTANLLQLIERLDHRPAVLISASATGYYGDQGDDFIDESSAPQPGRFMSDLCRLWEEEAIKARALGLRTCLLRLGMVFDWDGGPLPLLALPARFGFGAVLGGGRQWMPWVHRHDVVRMILRALDDPAWRGSVNAVAPDLVTQGAFTARLARWLRRPAFARAPAAPIRLALGPMADLFLASQRVLPAKLWRLGFTFERPTLEIAFDGGRAAGAVLVGSALPVSAPAEPVLLPVAQPVTPDDATPQLSSRKVA